MNNNENYINEERNYRRLMSLSKSSDISTSKSINLKLYSKNSTDPKVQYARK